MKRDEAEMHECTHVQLDSMEAAHHRPRHCLCQVASLDATLSGPRHAEKEEPSQPCQCHVDMSGFGVFVQIWIPHRKKVANRFQND